MKAIIYCRTSNKNRTFENEKSSDKNGKISLQLQESECRALADKLGFEVDAVYSDNNYSCITYPEGFEAEAKLDSNFQEVGGKMKIQNKFRQGLGDALKRIEKGDVKALIIRNETRLMRSLPYSNLFNTVYNFLAQKKVTVYTAEGKIINPGIFQHIFQETIVSLIEVNSMMEKIKNAYASKVHKLKNGEPSYLFPKLGFDYKNKKEILITEEMAIVRDIFQRFLKGESIRSITFLYRDKISFTATHLRRLLSSVAYTGHNHFRGEYYPLQIFKDRMSELITLDDFKIVQQKLKANAERKFKTSEVIHPLSGLVRCGCSGEPMKLASQTSAYSKHQKKYYVYRCRSKFEKVSTCNLKIKESSCIPITSLMKKFEVCGLLESLNPLLALALVENKIQERTLEADSKRLIVIDAELSKIAELRKKLVARVTKGLISDEELDSMLEDQNQRKKALEAEKIAIEQKIIVSKAFSKKDMLEISMDLMEGNLDRNIYRELAHKIFEKIVVFKDRIEVYFKGKTNFLTLPRMPYISTSTLPFGYSSIKAEKDLEVVYFRYSAYQGDKEMTLLYEDEGVKVWMVGK